MSSAGPTGRSLQGLRVLVAGATSAAGVAVATALSGAGAAVVAVGRDRARLAAGLGDLPGTAMHACDLADPAAVERLRDELAEPAGGGPIDGLIHLVGGWRGGGGITGQSEQDWEFLNRNVLSTLRNTSRVFYPQLTASPTGRLAIVSATAVEHPTADSASYAAVKAAAESWTRSVADGFGRDSAGQGKAGRDSAGAPAGTLRSAATILVVRALLDDAMRAAAPGRDFAGFTHVTDLAAAVVGLFGRDAATINGQRIRLVE